MNRLVLKVFVIFIVACVAMWVFWNNSDAKRPSEIGSLGTSENVQGSIYVWPKVLNKNGYTMTLNATRDLRIKKDETEIFYTTSVHAAALGDAFVVWVEKREDSPQSVPHFEVWLFDLASKQSRVLLPNIDNKQNPNSPPIAISGDQIALSTLANTLVLVNVKSGVSKTVPLPSEYRINSDSIHFSENIVIVAAYKSGTYRTSLLLGYNTISGTFNVLYQIPEKREYYTLYNVQSKNGTLYWAEGAQFSKTRFFSLQLGNGR